MCNSTWELYRVQHGKTAVNQKNLPLVFQHLLCHCCQTLNFVQTKRLSPSIRLMERCNKYQLQHKNILRVQKTTKTS